MSNDESLPAFPSGRGDEELGDGHAYATWGQRVGAYLFDFVLLFAVTLALATVLGAHTPFNVVALHAHDARRAAFASKLVAWWAIFALVGFVYATALLSSSRQATVGMRVCRLTIAREADDGTVHLGQATYRSGVYEGAVFVTNLIPLGFVLIFVDLLWPLWDHKRQTVHDKIAHTVVLRDAVAA